MRGSEDTREKVKTAFGPSTGCRQIFHGCVTGSGEKMDRVLFSSKSDEWETPKDVFDSLDAEFGFTLDPCATSENHKCDRFFTKEQNGLVQNWGGVQSSAIPPIAILQSGLRRHTGKD